MTAISITRAEDVERLWINPEQEYSHRVVTTKRQGSQALSFHVTTYAPGFTASVDGDGVHEVVMYCTHGSAQVTTEDGVRREMSPGAAIYLPLEFHYDLEIGPDGMTVAVACNPPKE
ncbi:hypothetical protein [Nakamurella endophytica]|uniref:N-acetyldiaminobutyrate dehydratase n=1 Tax=Nakamurella endophytica TaxID=1748367 RepID=A0A917WF98_9ACTN|nr:hypothetical protein [Nakamurella endophytica]GGL98130.1 hypothetical protein GCM10011594_17540 [Nakamurella endophytica]